MAAPQSSRTSTRSTSTGSGIHSPGAAAASFYRASSGYGARSSSYASSPSCPHHHQQHHYQQQHHHHTTPSSHGHHASSSSFANLVSSGLHHYYPSSASAFASSTSSSFLSSPSSRSAVPNLFHHHHHNNQRPASPTRVNLVTGGVASSAAAHPSVRFTLDSRSISPHNRGPITVTPSARRDPHPHQHPHHHYHHNHHSHHHPHPHLHHQHHHHHQISAGGRAIPSQGAQQHSYPHQRRTCMCSPTTHPGSFRCALHKAAAGASFGGGGSGSSYSSPSNRLNARRSAMTNSLVRIGTVEGDLVRRALAALIRPSSHQLRRRAAFQPRPSRLSVMSCAADEHACAAAA